MKTVKRMIDIVKLEKGELSKAYTNFLKKYFIQLYESFGEGEVLDSFCLGQDIVILEATDNSKELRQAGLKDGGLFGTFPEYIEKETLADGKKLWKVAVFHDNESMQVFFSQIGELDAEAEEWMVENYTSEELFSGEFLGTTASANPKDIT